MKRLILVITAMVLCLGLVSSLEAQQRRKQQTLVTLVPRRERHHRPFVAAQKSSQPLSRLTGAWNLMVSFDTSYGYSVVKADETRIESSAPSTISFRTAVSATSGPMGQSSQYKFTGTLKYDAPSQTYLLSIQKDGIAYVENLPMKYSEATGFAGTLSRTIEGKEVISSGKIVFKNGNEWSEGGNEWEICRATPCEQGLSRPGHALHFTFYKPKPKQ